VKLTEKMTKVYKKRKFANRAKQTAKRLTKSILAFVGFMLIANMGIEKLKKIDIVKLLTPQSPVILESIPAEAQEPTEATTPTPEAMQEPQKDENPDISEIVRKVYQLESSSGKNDDKCHRIGKHNGYGYRQGTNRNFCLNSDDEVKALVIDWFTTNLKNKTTAQALCYYNTGKATDTCEYYQNYNQIK